MRLKLINEQIYIYIYIYIYPDEGVAPSPTPQCSSYWKGEPSGRQLLLLYIYIHGPGDRGSIPGQVIPKTKEYHSVPPCLTHSIIKYVSRAKWSNPGKRVAPSPTPQIVAIETWLFGSPLITITSLYIYIYICVCVCVCTNSCRCTQILRWSINHTGVWVRTRDRLRIWWGCIW